MNNNVDDTNECQTIIDTSLQIGAKSYHPFIYCKHCMEIYGKEEYEKKYPNYTKFYKVVTIDPN
jgi:hypothetical protein